MAADLSSLPPDQQQAILDGPALRPPAGTQSNFDNPANHNAIPEAVIPICLVFVSLSIALRSYARLLIAKRIDVEDALMFIGFGTYLYYIYSVYHVTHTVGFFVHQWDVQLRTVQQVQRTLQIAANKYTITLAVVKTAIVLQWVRVFAPKGTRGVFFWVSHFIIWTSLLFYLATTVAGNLICVPFERIWDKTVPGVCINGRPLNTTMGAFILVSDICLLLLPQGVIWRLNMSLKRKLGIALTFAVGLLACSAAALRLGLTVHYMTSPDWLYNIASLSMACIGEMTCILLVYNMPGIPMAFREATFLPRMLSSLGSSLRSAKLRVSNNTSGGSATATKTIKNREKYSQMEENGISLDDYQQPTIKHTAVDEQLRGTAPQAEARSGYGPNVDARAAPFVAVD